MRKDSWLIAANTCIAKIYKVGKHQSLIQVEVLEHPESRLHNQDLVSDKPGRDFESMGCTRHSLEPHTSPKQHECIIFAKIVADYLKVAYHQGVFETLYLAASPNFLGLLRQTMEPAIAKSIAGETDKDMTQMDPKEIVAHVPFLIYSHTV